MIQQEYCGMWELSSNGLFEQEPPDKTKHTFCSFLALFQTTMDSSN